MSSATPRDEPIAMDVDPTPSAAAGSVSAAAALAEPSAATATTDDDDDVDVIQKLRNLEVLPDLFNLLHDLDSGVLSARDFEKNSGSVRLKLATLKQYLQEVDGISETNADRRARIDALTRSNARKCEFLSRVKATVEQELK